MRMTAFRSLIATSLAAASLSAAAATNPSAASASSSQGDLTITLNLTPHIIVTGLEDMTINASAADVTQTDNICIGGFGFSSFNVSFGSLNGNADVNTPNSSNPFLLLDSSTSETIPYSVGFANTASAGTADETSTDGSLSTNFARAAGATAASCLSSAENATLFVGINAADWQDVEGTAFTDTLTVMVKAI
ncbi:hypothetical protein [Microbulbifer thermotolerans]|nr:hypothetical protein [Microbulbifer thermotolerans]MCX2783451.1 hypothetical protein [Microbulbifer thermotolerans]MCX2795845.1 hypothetical protein [Microbulbifer thermotolerans]MCX2836332.1 hypothetical protein [Microbulbifer thermotolerans]WKT59715.1 hypothetical protein Q2E61_12525 [Microbulbifer thermotolerans]SFC63115.1 hypothetical protein SAMN05660479_02128 [Microbulbifer thermotolerans]